MKTSLALWIFLFSSENMESITCHIISDPFYKYKMKPKFSKKIWLVTAPLCTLFGYFIPKLSNLKHHFIIIHNPVHGQHNQSLLGHLYSMGIEAHSGITPQQVGGSAGIKMEAHVWSIRWEASHRGPWRWWTLLFHGSWILTWHLRAARLVPETRARDKRLLLNCPWKFQNAISTKFCSPK